MLIHPHARRPKPKAPEKPRYTRAQTVQALRSIYRAIQRGAIDSAKAQVVTLGKSLA